MATAYRLSVNEREFIESALAQDVRVDGRRPFDARRTRISFAREDGAVEVLQGETRVLAVVSAQLGPPYPDRPNEGSLAIFTEFSPMADPSFEPGRPSESAVELGRIIDRGLRESRAVDTESLCVLAGKAVWALRIDIHILDNGGNLVDVANVAALAALLSFRRPECTVGGADGQEVTVHPPDVREPLPLILHHLPIAVTFAFFGDGELAVLDPSYKEEAAMGGRLTLTVNAHGEVCAVQKGGGIGVRTSEIMRCLRIASSKASEIAALLKKAVEEHEMERAQRKIRRRQPVVPEPTKDILMVDAKQDTEPAHLDLPVESDTDSEEEEAKPQEEQEEKPQIKEETRIEVGTTAMFQGGLSSWETMETEPMRTKAATLGVEAAVKSQSEVSIMSAAVVYASGTLSKVEQQAGPFAPKEPEMKEPASLLDAVKKKSKRRRRANNG